MNAANVEALRVLAAEWGARVDRGEATEGLAEFLAARGVLVPAAMTVRDVEAVADGWNDGGYFGDPDVREDGSAHMRAVLERIARGEPS